MTTLKRKTNHTSVNIENTEQRTKKSDDHARLIEIQKKTMNKALAEQFPEWDLLPPQQVLRRKRRIQ